jgi:hypothetical protein
VYENDTLTARFEPRNRFDPPWRRQKFAEGRHAKDLILRDFMAKWVASNPQDIPAHEGDDMSKPKYTRLGFKRRLMKMRCDASVACGDYCPIATLYCQGQDPDEANKFVKELDHDLVTAIDALPGAWSDATPDMLIGCICAVDAMDKQP